MLMKLLQIILVKPGTFRTYMESKNKLWWQHKLKRLWNEREELMKEMWEFIS
jgi:hypothetical protein